MSEEIHQVPSTTPNFQTELASQLAELMPEVIADGKVDVGKLKELLDVDVADTSERFGLFWPGKKRALRAAQEPTTATLRPDFEKSKDWATTKNVFIEGDNLEVLKILQKHYHAKIKMIYIDPPYNTGKDFVYPDNYKEGLDTYLEWTRQVNEEGKKRTTNSETEGRYHSNWLNMMYPRLKLARNLLARDGVIACSISDHEQAQLRRLMDEVFGESNFLGTLIWDMNNSAQAGLFKVYHQYVHVYARNVSYVVNPSDESGELFEDRAQKRPSQRHVVSEFKFPKGTRWDAPDGTTLSGTWGGAESVTLVSGKMSALNGKLTEDIVLAAAWTQKNQMDQYFNGDRDNLIDSRGQKVVEFYFSQSGKCRIVKKRGVLTPATVRHNWGSQSVVSTNLATLFNSASSPFDSPKPVSMIQDFASWFVKDNEIMLDFFAGSATTAHGVLQQNLVDGLNRRFILVQLPEPVTGEAHATIADIARERITLAAAEVESLAATRSEEETVQNFDTGFRSYRLSDTNFSKWSESSNIDRNQLEQRLFELRDSSSSSSASSHDLLSEILLKQGSSLTEHIEPIHLAGLTLYAVEHGVILAYLDERVKPTLEQLRTIADEDPVRLIILEDAFQGDDQLKTNLVQLCKSRNIELWTA